MAHDHKHHDDDHAFEHRLSFWAGMILLIVLIAILINVA
jgi:hypothetical protein